MLVAVIAGFAQSKIGVGPCPTVPTIANPFNAGGVVTDGIYNLMRFDNQFVWGWSNFASLPGESLNCQFANVAKTTSGFSWTQTKPVDAFNGWPTQVPCNSTQCASYFPGKPLKVVYWEP